jgi:hypothetical protein
MARLRFLPQSTLDAWSDEGKVDLRFGGRLVEISTSAEYPTREALRFLKVESGLDAQKLVRKVKTIEQVKAMGGEHCTTSVLLGDTVYEVAPGWVIEEPADGAAPAARAASPAASAQKGADSKKYEKSPETDILAKLLLDKLS